MRLRIIAMGLIEIILTVALYMIRGFHPVYLLILIAGVVIVLIGLLGK
ncbi:MAG: hypothetical protein ACP5UO_05585 [Thermoplasmata archaeon]